MRRAAYHTCARPDRARAARSRPRAARGRAGRDFSSKLKLAWLDSHRIMAVRAATREKKAQPCNGAYDTPVRRARVPDSTACAHGHDAGGRWVDGWTRRFAVSDLVPVRGRH